MERIYLLEDDDSIRKLVLYALNAQGFEATGFARPALFWSALEKEVPALLLLDLMLPEEDGLSVLKRLRASAATKHLPVIILTAKNAEYDRVLGLDSGADDFLCKPFGIMELTARIRAVLRRSGEKPSEPVYQLGDLTVDTGRHTVTQKGEEIQLTNKEYALLCQLLSHPGMVMTRALLMDSVWGETVSRENRTLDVHIRTLRAKLGEAGSRIATVRGIGYKIEDTP